MRLRVRPDRTGDVAATPFRSLYYCRKFGSTSIEPEPLLSGEKKLIVGSVLTGVVLLGLLIWISNIVSPLKTSLAAKTYLRMVKKFL